MRLNSASLVVLVNSQSINHTGISKLATIIVSSKETTPDETTRSRLEEISRYTRRPSLTSVSARWVRLTSHHLLDVRAYRPVKRRGRQAACCGWRMGPEAGADVAGDQLDDLWISSSVFPNV